MRPVIHRLVDQPGHAGTIGERPGLRLLLVSYLLAAIRRQVRSVADAMGKMSVQRLRGMSRASAANHSVLRHTPAE